MEACFNAGAGEDGHTQRSLSTPSSFSQCVGWDVNIRLRDAAGWIKGGSQNAGVHKIMPGSFCRYDSLQSPAPSAPGRRIQAHAYTTRLCTTQT